MEEAVAEIEQLRGENENLLQTMKTMEAELENPRVGIPHLLSDDPSVLRGKLDGFGKALEVYLDDDAAFEKPVTPPETP